MPGAREQMKIMKEELEKVRAQIEKLQVEEAVLCRMMKRMGDESVRKGRGNRALGVKAAILNHVADARHAGATTADARRAIEVRIPTVSDNTVRSVLSSLKGDGGLAYVEERYYAKEFEPKAEPDPKVTQLPSRV